MFKEPKRPTIYERVLMKSSSRHYEKNRYHVVSHEGAITLLKQLYKLTIQKELGYNEEEQKLMLDAIEKDDPHLFFDKYRPHGIKIIIKLGREGRDKLLYESLPKTYGHLTVDGYKKEFVSRGRLMARVTCHGGSGNCRGTYYIPATLLKRGKAPNMCAECAEAGIRYSKKPCLHEQFNEMKW